MKIRHEIGKSVIIHEMEPGIERLYVERMREGRREEMEAYLEANKRDLMRPRECYLCERTYIPGELSRESFALGWALGNWFDGICMVCYSEILMRALREMEKSEAQ